MENKGTFYDNPWKAYSKRQYSQIVFITIFKLVGMVLYAFAKAYLKIIIRL
ncbi:hypothetical protein [uncultured Dokdonia sp.]|uniref:hypothetical protein n=1 Tax=uncultured Dokdonia sp. TaxID=575653 RepID=UPI002636B313|nr:hypothetical protein [uncultured Dokdonia sp.]